MLLWGAKGPYFKSLAQKVYAVDSFVCWGRKKGKCSINNGLHLKVNWVAKKSINSETLLFSSLPLFKYQIYLGLRKTTEQKLSRCCRLYSLSLWYKVSWLKVSRLIFTLILPRSQLKMTLFSDLMFQYTSFHAKKKHWSVRLKDAIIT